MKIEAAGEEPEHNKLGASVFLKGLYSMAWSINENREIYSDRFSLLNVCSPRIKRICNGTLYTQMSE